MIGVNTSIFKSAGRKLVNLLGTLKNRATYYENGTDSTAEKNRIESLGILDDATILLTPTAISDARVHSVKTYTGNELVTNGDFSDGRNDWTNNASATLSTENDKLKVSISGAGSGYGQQNITGLTIGATYKISAEGEIGTSTRLALYTPNAGFNNLYADGAISTFFTATSTTENLRLYVYDDGAYGFWDNVSVIDVSSDFDFDRASSATRINSSGLVQDMQSITDPELVLNGDFEELGDDLVTNGSFDTDSDWNKAPSGVTIIGGSANFNSASDTYVYQDILTATKTYKIIFSGTINSGSFYIGENGVATNTYTSGTYTNEVAYFTVSSSARFIIRKTGVGTLDASIDNVSVQQVDPNDRWSLSGAANFEDGVLHFESNTNEYSYARQDISSLAASTYKIQLEIKNYVSGACQVGFSGTSPNIVNLNVTSDGIYTAYVSPNANGDDLEISRNFGGGNFNFDVDNISVKDITFSTDVDLARISYDSNGDNGHILLEPTSTNLLPYSEDFSEWASSNATLESGYDAPDGSTNAYKVTGTVGSSTVYFAGVPNLSSTSTRTIWARTVSGTGTINLCSYGDNSNNNFTITEEWQRFEVNGTTTSTGESNFYATDFRFQQPNALTEIIIWGAQAENLSYATSYIPTYGSTVTRATETLTGSGNSTLINSTEGVLYAEIAALAEESASKRITISDGTLTNRITLSVAANIISGFINVNNVTQYTFFESGQNITSFNKIAVKYKANDFALWINGVEYDVDTSGSTFSANTLNVINFANATITDNDFYGKVKALAVFNEALSDSELTQLTT